jgi:DNA-binding response OmpR family regulator
MEPQETRTASRALVVDDDGLVRMVVSEVLRQSGLEVCEAESGAQALEMFAASRPDIVVLDVMMPGLDGFATCAKLRGSVGGSRVPILIMTGLDDAESIARAYEQGATDFITKPLNPVILSHRVRYMLRGSHILDGCSERSEASWRNGSPRLAPGRRWTLTSLRRQLSSSSTGHSTPGLLRNV